MVQVGIIGLGFMGLTHLKVYQKHPRARIVAVADQIKKRLEGDLSGVQGNIMGPGERFDFSDMATYDTVDGILDDPHVELVSVCLPTFTHAEIACKALERGKHVLCEKPMALAEAELDAMLAAAERSSARLMVAQCIRFWPEYATAREIVRSGALGAVRGARFERRSAFPTWGGWLGDEAKSGGAIMDLSIHDIDFAHHLLGLPRRVRADGYCDLTRPIDYYQGLLAYDGCTVNIEGSWYPKGEYPFNAAFDIICEDGVVSWNLGQQRPLTVYRADGSAERPQLADGDGYDHEIDYFIRCVEEGTPPDRSPPGESALSVKLGLLLKESRSRGGVELEAPKS